MIHGALQCELLGGIFLGGLSHSLCPRDRESYWEGVGQREDGGLCSGQVCMIE